MAKIVSEIADIAILTDDDAGEEDRWDILDDARRGFVDTDLGVRSFIVPQRRLAIQFAKEILQS
jgi:UDP-N-acetylmuramyl tripeptide synthase